MVYRSHSTFYGNKLISDVLQLLQKCLGEGGEQAIINSISDDLNEFGHFCHNGDNTFCNKTQFGEPVYKKTLAYRNSTLVFCIGITIARFIYPFNEWSVISNLNLCHWSKRYYIK